MSETLGNFWVDITRLTLYLFLPLATLLSLVLIHEGAIDNFMPYQEAITLEGKTQVIPMGPVASQVAIKQLGTNGGGFFNTNSAHPFENPSGLSNFLESLAILLIPAALTYTYGHIMGSKRHGWILFFAMLFLWAVGLAIAYFAEHQVNPLLPLTPHLEGKELRFGNINSIFWGISTTATANGSVNAMLDSFSPLAGGVALFNMMLGELLFGGLGVGLCSMLFFVLFTLFLAGLMVGRTPEYLGKKMGKNEIYWIACAILVPSMVILLGTSVIILVKDLHLVNKGPHAFSEVIYALTSATANNGSAFAGFDTNTPFLNIIFGICMILGRLAIIVPSIAIAGLFARKKASSEHAGVLSSNSALFFVLLILFIVIVESLAFFPALALGPIAEHILMLRGYSF